MGLQKQRFDEIDIAKGIGILIVVYSHAIRQMEVHSQLISDIVLIIQSFVMPLFFILSGYVSTKLFRLTRDEIGGYVKDRAIRLLIPYFFMNMLYLPLKMIMSSVALRPYDIHSAWEMLIGRGPDTTLWFLYILFWCHVIGTVILKRDKLVLILIISFIISALAHIFDSPAYLPTYFVYFVLGLFVREHYSKILPFFKLKFFIPALIVFVGMQVISISTGVNVSFPVASITGSFVFWYISYIISQRETIVKKVLVACGVTSMDIYVLSDPIMICLRIVLIGFLKLPETLCMGLFFVISTVVSYFSSVLIIRKVPLFRLLLLGMYEPSKK